jgi:hypothetical protein
MFLVIAHFTFEVILMIVVEFAVVTRRDILEVYPADGISFGTLFCVSVSSLLHFLFLHRFATVCDPLSPFRIGLICEDLATMWNRF